MRYFFCKAFTAVSCLLTFMLGANDETSSFPTIKKEFHNEEKLFTKQDVINALQLPMSERAIKNPLKFDLAKFKFWKGTKNFFANENSNFESNESASAVSFALYDAKLHKFQVIISKEQSCYAASEKILNNLLSSYSLWSLIPKENTAEYKDGVYMLESLKTPQKTILDLSKAFTITVFYDEHDQLRKQKYNRITSKKSIDAIISEIQSLLTD